MVLRRMYLTPDKKAFRFACASLATLAAFKGRSGGVPHKRDSHTLEPENAGEFNRLRILLSHSSTSTIAHPSCIGFNARVACVPGLWESS